MTFVAHSQMGGKRLHGSHRRALLGADFQSGCDLGTAGGSGDTSSKVLRPRIEKTVISGCMSQGN